MSAAYPLILFAGVLLTHSCFSAHEHLSLPSTHSPSHTIPFLSPTLPADIVLETLLGTILLALGVVLANGSGKLREISYRHWSGKLEREKGCGPGMVGMLAEEGGRAGGGFWAVRKAREEVGGVEE